MQALDGVEGADTSDTNVMQLVFPTRIFHIIFIIFMSAYVSE